LEATVFEQQLAKLERATARSDADRRDQGDQADNDERRRAREQYNFGDAP
jgi:hypothetical protein